MQQHTTRSSSNISPLEEKRKLVKKLKTKRDKTWQKKCMLEEQLEHELAEMEARITNLREEVAKKSRKLKELDARYVIVAKEFTDLLAKESDNLSLKVAKSKKTIETSDLQLVSGIGTRLQEILHGAGIKNLEDLAKQDPEQLQDILLEASPYLRLMNSNSWPAQAAQLLQKSDVA